MENSETKIIHTLAPYSCCCIEDNYNEQQAGKVSLLNNNIDNSGSDACFGLQEYSYFESMMTTNQYHHYRNVYVPSNSSSSMVTPQQQQQLQQQQQSNQIQQSRSSQSQSPSQSNILKPLKNINVLNSGVVESSKLLLENQKLASITRLCIHLVDRCRSLNKSKQFIKDLTRLGNLIDEFNSTNTRKHSQLPTFNNAGLVFDKPSIPLASDNVIVTYNNNSGRKYAIVKETVINPSQITNNQNSVDSVGGNMYLIPIINNQTIQQFQLSSSNDETILNNNNSISETKSKFKKITSTAVPTPTLLTTNPTIINNNQADTVIQQDQFKQSILFKKLTQSGQLIDTQMLVQQPQQQHISMKHDSQDIVGGGDNNNSVMFSTIVQQQTNQNNNNHQNVDCSNIENNPHVKRKNDNSNNRNSKVYKCIVCEKIFANAYNLNRHSKSHTGFQPFVCNYPDCFKKFNYSYHLKRHMETHIGLRPFACTWPDCDQRFNRKYNLNRHLWVHTDKQKKFKSKEITLEPNVSVAAAASAINSSVFSRQQQSNRMC